MDVFYVDKCLLCEVTIKNKKGYIIVSNRSSSQKANEFDKKIILKNYWITLNSFVHLLFLHLMILIPGQNYGVLKI